MIIRPVHAAALSLMAAALIAPAHAGKSDVIVAPASISASGAPDAEIRATDWEDGKRQELSGLKQLEEARDNLKDAQKALRKAEEKRVKAHSKTDQAKRAYRQTATTIGQAEAHPAAMLEMKRFAKSVDDWKDSAEALARSEKRVAETKASLAAAESAVRNAEELIAAGRLKMQSANAASVSIEDVIAN